jgi:hypothetical protein
MYQPWLPTPTEQLITNEKHDMVRCLLSVMPVRYVAYRILLTIAELDGPLLRIIQQRTAEASLCWSDATTYFQSLLIW